jgi:putative DNA primase/helicase
MRPELIVEVSGESEVQASSDDANPALVGAFDEVSEVSMPAVPPENERPCFRVFDEAVTAESYTYRPGVWFFDVRPGKKDAPTILSQQWVCSPLHVDAVTTDAHGYNYGRLLRFRTTLGTWRTWAMPMELLRGDGSELRGELLGMGVEIAPDARNQLATYLQSGPPRRSIHCLLQTGWAGTDFRAFVLPDEVIGPKRTAYVYQSGERGHDDYATAGTLLDWQQDVAALAVGNPLLMLSLCVAFAGALLSLCNAESGGIHFVGDSSCGKTTMIDAGCSVWGGPGHRRSRRATGNGIEGAAALFNDSLLALDEISECDPREVGAIIYALGNGRGKQRASRTGIARPVNRWRTSVLSSGERTIGTVMDEAGQRIKAGQAVRLLDVPAQRRHGAWDCLHGHASGAALSDVLKRAAATHYGHAGRAFLEHLTRDNGSFTGALDELKRLPEFEVANDDGQVKRAAARFALLALAGERATTYGLTGWPEGEAIRAAAVAFSSWRTLRGLRKGNLERDQAADLLREFIERHGDSRFSDVDAGNTVQVRDRAGWWKKSSDRRVYLFTSAGMREALKGLDFHRALDALQDIGAIEAPGADGKRAKFRRIHGVGIKVYEVDIAHLDSDTA